jgi:hypothetical protein
MNVFTQVNRIMTEWSVEKCLQECTKGQICTQATEPCDTAIATYAGSMEGAEGTGQGYLLYSLADQLCAEFATCSGSGGIGDPKQEDIEGTAGVNLKIIQQFQSGRYDLEVGNCQLADLIKSRIVQLMTVPLIQGTLDRPTVFNIRTKTLKKKRDARLSLSRPSCRMSMLAARRMLRLFTKT